MEQTVKFSNEKMSKKAAGSIDWTYEGQYASPHTAREKAVNLLNSGKQAFYKRIKDKRGFSYFVYSFA